jgi:hypothetical protein
MIGHKKTNSLLTSLWPVCFIRYFFVKFLFVLSLTKTLLCDGVGGRGGVSRFYSVVSSGISCEEFK